ncbi:hypothetical protein AAJCM20276_32330 [Acetobacter aceti]|uniref:Uncharacterized protein n=1 Tax=Acetobacter aceti TaxID=435 RepID=A0A6S6PME8_ACEAC|nr:hypothetical protein AAJCM20276_32330 [Acetobacter aceti]
MTDNVQELSGKILVNKKKFQDRYPFTKSVGDPFLIAADITGMCGQEVLK